MKYLLRLRDLFIVYQIVFIIQNFNIVHLLLFMKLNYFIYNYSFYASYQNLQ
jgi:hypothetical protein